jgi:hypothetical protein
MYFRVAGMLYSFALGLILNGVFGEVQNNEQKRLLLHSDTDIATEILTMKSQFNAQAVEIKAQTSEINSLKQQLYTYEHSGKGMLDVILVFCFSIIKISRPDKHLNTTQRSDLQNPAQHVTKMLL